MTVMMRNTATSNPWNALWAMLVGFFMILVDSTIVAVANPSIMEKLGTDYDTVLWVTSAYLLAYAVPLLVAGRLGDQFGPKNLYVIGLFIFTAASMWCGLAGSIGMLVAARVVQGIGAALLTPQTLSTITRTFPAERRGVAMSVWGATAGVATLVGPLAGGLLVDHLGWQWIFFVNVPIGIIGLALAVWLVPALPTTSHRFDIPGILLSGVAMFLIVFGLQEGEDNHWSAWIWVTVAAGVILMGVFVGWQAVNKREPLIPLRIFRDRNYSMSNIGVAVIGFTVTAMIVPVMFYAQVVCGLTPTESALLTAPMAVATGVMAPFVGRLVDRMHPTLVIGFGFSVLAISLTWLAVEMTPTTPIWRLLIAFTAMGLGMAFIWSPLAATATRNLAADVAGAGSGAYNATRQVGSALGGAGIAAFMSSRIAAAMPGGQAQPQGGTQSQLPDFLREPFSVALSQSMLLPAFVCLLGVVAALFMVGSTKSAGAKPAPVRPDPREDDTEVLAIVPEFAPAPDDYWQDRHRRHPRFGDADFDDDDYVEFTVEREPGPSAFYAGETGPVYGDQQVEVDDDLSAYPGTDETVADDTDTAPLAIRVGHPQQAPAEVWHSAPVESWHSLLEDYRPLDDILNPDPPEPIGFAHNGFHVDDEEKFQPVPPEQPEPEPDTYAHLTNGFQRIADEIDSLSDSFADFLTSNNGAYDQPRHGVHPGIDGRPSRHSQPDDDDDDGDGGSHVSSNGQSPRRARHYREDPDDGDSRGRHAQPSWE